LKQEPSGGLPQGATVGRYFVLRKLGEGAMGVVYAAFDPKLDRKIALKLMQPSSGEGRERVRQARLVREAQAMARVSHPNVVAVHDVGAHGDQVFIAMELVEGGTLAQWVEQRPRKLQEILKAFGEAGAGLAAAHAAGLVHRDFKPDNVLMGADGRVRVTDFGLARLEETTDESLRLNFGRVVGSLTQAGAIIGTPLFMSPEQARGNVPDARSDQYCFCASLHWAIFGVAPPGLDPSGSGWVTAPEAAAADPGRRPPALTLPHEPKLPANLRRALLRGLAWDAAERYPSMSELLAELSLDQRLITQRRMAIGVVALLAVVAAGLGVVQATRPSSAVCQGAERRLAGVWDQGVRDGVRRAFIEADPGGGERTAGLVVDSLDRYTRRWVATRTDACEATRIRGEESEGILSLRTICLDRRLHQVEVLGKLFRAADIKLVQKAVDAVLELPDLGACDAAVLSAAPAPPEDPEVRARIESVGQALDEARALYGAGRYKLALPLASSAAEEATALRYWPLTSEALFWKGWLLERTGDSQQAEAVLRQAVVAAQIARSDVDQVRALSKLVFVNGNSLGRFEESRFFADAAQVLLASLGNEELEFELRMQLGSVLGSKGKSQEAMAEYRRALEVADRAVGPDHPRKGMLLSNLAAVGSVTGRYDEALELLQQALGIFTRSRGPNHPSIAYVHYNVADVYRLKGDYRRSLQSIQECLRIREATLGPDHPEVANALDRLAQVLLADGLHAEALEESEKALAIKEKALGVDHLDLCYSLENIGAALVGLRQPAKAIPPLERAIALRQKAAMEPGELAEARFSLARALWDAARDRARARALARQARDGYLEKAQYAEAEQIAAWLASR
jgi:tetratricopeptide (TPR) repeat protein